MSSELHEQRMDNSSFATRFARRRLKNSHIHPITIKMKRRMEWRTRLVFEGLLKRKLGQMLFFSGKAQMKSGVVHTSR